MELERQKIKIIEMELETRISNIDNYTLILGEWHSPFFLYIVTITTPYDFWNVCKVGWEL